MSEKNKVRKRLKTLQSNLGDFDAVVATSLENTFYFSGSYISTVRLIPNRLSMLLLPREGEPCFVVCNIEESLVRSQSPIADVRAYVEFAESPVDLLAEAIKERGLDRARIGIEGSHLPTRYALQLKGLLPEVKLGHSDEVFARIRAVKDDDEIRALEIGALVTERAIYAAWDAARPGTTERAIAETIMTEMVNGGADILSFMCFAGGLRCSHAHPVPGDYKIRTGDLVRVDVGGLFQHYQSDVARTGIMGKPDPKHAKMYEAIYRGQEAVIEAMRPGTKVGDLYRLCKRTIEDRGVSFHSPHIGHCVGIGLHEEPIIHPFNSTRLEADMVFYIEPFVLVPGKSAYHVEDLVRVTPGGGELLTDPSRKRSALYVL